MKKRYFEFDIARGIGMLLIIWGHMGGVGSVFYKSFFVQVFWFLAGITSNFNDKKSIKKEMVSLNIFYITFSALFLLFDLIVRVCILHHNMDWVYKGIIQTLTFDGINVLWFVSTTSLALYWSDKFLTYFSTKHHMCLFMALLLSVLAIYINRFFVNLSTQKVGIYNSNELILTAVDGIRYVILRPIYAMFFVVLGSRIREYYLVYREKIMKKSFFNSSVIIILNICLLFTTRYNGQNDSHYLNFGNSIFLFYINALVGTFMICYLSFFINTGFEMIKKALIYIGRNSLFIMGTHMYFSITVIFRKIIDYLPLVGDLLKLIISFMLVIVFEALLVKMFGEKYHKQLKEYTIKILSIRDV